MGLATDLKTRRDAIGEELAALDATLAGGKPNAAGPNAVDHVGYKDGLYRELASIQKSLEDLGESLDGSSLAADTISDGYV